MKYTLRTGSLYQESSAEPLARIKCSTPGPNKKIYLQGDTVVLQADIVIQNGVNVQQGNVQNRRYELTNQDGQKISEARPGYADGENPDQMGWPICRLPKVDHAQLFIHERTLLLIMHSDKEYSIHDEGGVCILTIAHKGISGGWMIQDNFGFTPDVLCGLFAFCRYLEKENEFIVV